jgi:hypothetical protein
MSKLLNKLPEKIKRQIINITKFSSLPDCEKSIITITKLWLKKEEVFLKELKKFKMIETDLIEMTDTNGAIILTYSGSILKISPEIENARRIEYTSIGLRKDVPENLVVDDVKLAYDIILDEPVEFANSKIRSTSPTYKIGVCNKTATFKDQFESLDTITNLIYKNFVDLNREYLE